MELLRKSVVTPLAGSQVILREGDGYADRMLSKNANKLSHAIPDYLAFMIVSVDNDSEITRDKVLELLVPDYEYLLIEAYKLNYGDDLEFRRVCRYCGAYDEHSVPIGNLPVVEPPAGHTGGKDPVYTIMLPRTKKKASLGFMKVKNELIIADQGDVPDPNQIDYLSLRSIEGVDDLSYESVVGLPLADHKAIRKQKAKMVCGYDPVVSVRCPSCEAVDAVNILGLRDFLFFWG